jgi:CheY-like chemotaxis protein
MCKKEIILCVDDEENQLAVRKLVLESEGYAVLTAASGRSCLVRPSYARLDRGRARTPNQSA